MNKLISKILFIGCSGFLSAWMGLIIGIISSLIVKGKGRRIRAFTFAFMGGLMIGIVCFDLIPEAIILSNVFITLIGLILGLILSVMLDGKLELIKVSNNDNRFLKPGIFMAIAIGIHHTPMGLALGSLLSTNPTKSVNLILAIILHGIPEGLALGVFFNDSKLGALSLTIISILTSIPMGVGALLGGIVSNISTNLISMSIAFAGGMILYIIYGETLPNAQEIWKGRLSTLGIIFGLIIGILIVSI
jgi:ZIP family zinc transporter